ncbi:glycine hydroxymethyltransferase [Nematocida homosporus]|uniref:glycine hydroxymethyltransferase n=1 Tax=Nematocida homosporus TaxID=1912981 RepID=UPI0022202059|nr:glycine hydroxymethyltransferase [Nematocida homosporus]KAI5186748.1 glycine hydroxymethyltransferase [Nematocida homosporus]
MGLIDTELHVALRSEEARQQKTLTLIASENYVFPDVYLYAGSVLTNKYSEGRVGARYYGGTQYIDVIESMCQARALSLFGLDPAVWGVSVQPYSGSVANFAAYSALIGPGGKIMGMNLPSGGHLTHGFQTKSKKVSATSLYFSSFPYRVTEEGFIDYDELREQFLEVCPEILICGYSAHSQDLDYQQLRDIVGDKAFLYADISHIAGIIAAGRMNSPFTYCDVVMTTTHKSLRGPRGAVIFYRKSVTVKDTVYDLDQRINSAVFPFLQGGPHNQTIAGIAHAMYMAAQPEYQQYIDQVLLNAKAMARAFQARNYQILTGSTTNHMLIIDLKNKHVGGSEVEFVCDLLNLNINKNTVPKDTSPLKPSGIRVGVYAITTRGLKEADATFIVEVIDFAVSICTRYTQSNPTLPISQWLTNERITTDPDFIKYHNKILALSETHPAPVLSQ